MPEDQDLNTPQPNELIEEFNDIEPRPEAGPAEEPTPAPDDNAIKPAEPFALEHPPTPPAPEPKKLTQKEKDKNAEEASQSPFSITVGKVYDGPLDLLLDLIRKQNIDIYDIPIARITAQFLSYTHNLKETDVDAAGEFVYVAALLIHIKSKTLLPRDPLAIAAGTDDDPRRELVERLLEHERFKAAAQMLQQKQMLEEATWSQPGMKSFLKDAGLDSKDGEREIDADTVDLVRVFQDILHRCADDRLRQTPLAHGRQAHQPAPHALEHQIRTRPHLHLPRNAGARPPAGHPASPIRATGRYPRQEDRPLRTGLCRPGRCPRRLGLAPPGLFIVGPHQPPG